MGDRTEEALSAEGIVEHRVERDRIRQGDDREALIAPTLARAVATVAFCAFAGVAMLWVVYLGNGPGRIALALACLSALLCLQYFYFCLPSADLRSPLAYAMLATQAALVYLPLPMFDQAWVSQPSFLAGSVLLVLPRRLAWPAYAAVVAGTGIAQAAFATDAPVDVIYILVNTATAGLYLYGLTRLARFVVVARQARDDLAEAVVAYERLRFARDLRDALESSLSAIALKGALALRLIRQRPERAGQELSEVLDLARQSAADVRSVARVYRDTPPRDRTEASDARPAADSIGRLVPIVLCGLFVQAMIRVFWEAPVFWDAQGLWQTGFAAACLLAALALQLGHFSRPSARLHSAASHWLLVLLAVLVCLPWVELWGVPWTGLPGLLAGSALLVLRPVPGWAVFIAIAVVVGWSQIGSSSFYPRTVGGVFVTVNLGLLTFGLTWLARTARQLRATRRERAALALAETRLRFSRDLHDLLGLGLSAMTLKLDLAHRLLALDPDRARTELEEALGVAARALAEVREVASGRHRMSLDEELRSTRSVLTAAGMEVQVDARYGELPLEVGVTLAAVLREGVTNVLRHSKGEHCEITIATDGGEVALSIVNDGATPSEDTGGQGSGIRNMAERVAAVHGVLRAVSEPGGTFALRARIPLLG